MYIFIVYGWYYQLFLFQNNLRLKISLTNSHNKGGQLKQIRPCCSALQSLELFDNRIDNITGIGTLTNLTSLNLSDNMIQDISSLGSLSSLKKLYLADNQITDINILGSLSGLTVLDAHDNLITDVSILKNLHNIQETNIDHSQL